MTRSQAYRTTSTGRSGTAPDGWIERPTGATTPTDTQRAVVRDG